MTWWPEAKTSAAWHWPGEQVRLDDRGIRWPKMKPRDRNLIHEFFNISPNDKTGLQPFVPNRASLLRNWSHSVVRMLRSSEVGTHSVYSYASFHYHANKAWPMLIIDTGRRSMLSRAKFTPWTGKFRHWCCYFRHYVIATLDQINGRYAMVCNGFAALKIHIPLRSCSGTQIGCLYVLVLL